MEEHFARSLCCLNVRLTLTLWSFKNVRIQNHRRKRIVTGLVISSGLETPRTRDLEYLIVAVVG